MEADEEVKGNGSGNKESQNPHLISHNTTGNTPTQKMEEEDVMKLGGKTNDLQSSPKSRVSLLIILVPFTLSENKKKF